MVIMLMVCAGSAVTGPRWLLVPCVWCSWFLGARFAYFCFRLCILWILCGEVIEIASQHGTLRLSCKSKYCDY